MKIVVGWVAGVLFVIAVGAVVEGLGGNSTPAPEAPPGIYALVSGGPGTHALVVQLSPGTGGIVRTVATLPVVPQTGIPYCAVGHPIFVDSLAMGPDGDLWFDESSHAPCQPELSIPSFPDDHCSGAVLRLDPVDGAIAVVLRTSPRLALFGVAPSPDGRKVALVIGPCTLHAVQSWIVVDDLSTGRQWDLGTPGPLCTLMSTPVWLQGGAHLATVVTSFHYYPQATNQVASCGGTSATALAILPALETSAFAAARLVPPIGARCEDDAIATSGSVLLVAQSCGPTDGAIDRGMGTVRFVTLEGVLKSTFRLPRHRFVVDLCVRRVPSAILLGIAQSESPSTYYNSLEVQFFMLRGQRLRVLPLVPSPVAALAC